MHAWTSICVPEPLSQPRSTGGVRGPQRLHLYLFWAALLASCWANVRFFHLLTFSLVRLKKPLVLLLPSPDASPLVPASMCGFYASFPMPFFCVCMGLLQAGATQR